MLAAGNSSELNIENNVGVAIEVDDPDDGGGAKQCEMHATSDRNESQSGSNAL